MLRFPTSQGPPSGGPSRFGVHDLHVLRFFNRTVVAGAVLLIPVALTLGSTVRKDVDAIREHSRLTAIEADVVPPFGFGASRNVPLLLGIRRLVPEDARVSFLPSGGAEARRNFVRTGWIRWVAFVIAPRLVDAGAGARWVVLVDRSPRAAEIRPRRAWRFGRDWLLER
jgi:hypothetical protein